MKYLLDTHALIWYFEDSPELPKNITDIIDDENNQKAIASASLWEIAIKTGLNKLDMRLSFDDLLAAIASTDLQVLQIEDEYLKILAKLPFLHKDPFDRLLVSTAIAENMTIITVDENIHKYDAKWVWGSRAQ